MTRRHLEIFVETANAQSITKAAHALYISQPTVSIAVREVEKHYGIRLFDRINQRIVLTSQGEAFLEYSRHIIQLFKDLDKAFMNPDAGGSLRIGCSVVFGIHELPTLLKAFRNQYPHIKVRADINSSDYIENKILTNEIDIAVIEGNVHSPYIKSALLFKDELIAVCAPQHPFAEEKKLDLMKFSQGEFLLREPRSGIQEHFLEAMRVMGHEVAPAWESTSFEVLIEGAKNGLGIAVLPQKLVREELEQGSLVRLMPEGLDIQRSIRLIMHKNKFISAGMRLWMALLAVDEDALKFTE